MNKKYIFGNFGVIVFLSAFLLLSGTCIAQNKSEALTALPKHEVGFSFGAYPVMGLLDPAVAEDPSVGLIGTWPSYYENFTTTKGDTINWWLIGSFTLNYYYNIDKFHAFGLQSTVAFRHFTSLHNRLYQPYTSLNAYWSLQASYRVTFMRRPSFTFYSGLSFGTTFYFIDERWYDGPFIIPFFQFTGFGVSFGKRNCGNVELGFGTQGVFKVGYSVRF